ncbi:MAG: hypothetical protein FJ403_20290 [Verrucomicrobia bacterium]|nr:hypothetical protein [Verrucomicrobiota bacterium]
MTANKKRIVCGTDFSAHAAEAATVAALMAARLNKSLVLLHVLQHFDPGQVSDDVSGSRYASLQKRLHHEAERLRKLGPPCVREKLITGSPYEKLVEAGECFADRA